MAGFSSIAEREALDGIGADRIRLHSGDPGTAGTDNVLGAGLSAATWNAATTSGATSSRALNAGVLVTGLAALQSVTYFSIWLNSGTVFKVGVQITSGDVQANASGEYTLAAGSTFSSTG